MPGLVPGIHDLKQSHWKKNVDGRDKPGHDEFVRRLSVLTNDRKSGLHFQSDSQDEGELVDPWFMPKRK
jgi:hypothetical protein